MLFNNGQLIQPGWSVSQLTFDKYTDRYRDRLIERERYINTNIDIDIDGVSDKIFIFTSCNHLLK